MSFTTGLEYFKAVLQLTKVKVESSELFKEYQLLEQVPPAPGQPHKQHSVMVNKGLCKKACRHPYKNRYCNLYPFDSNLVLIGNNTNGDDGDRYINASWIDLPGAKSRYIATMGPMHPASYSTKQKPDNDGVEDTIPDFWEMCWSTKEHFTERQFRLRKEGSDEAREVVHLQFKSWPNYGVPEGTGPIADFVRLVHARAGTQKRGHFPELIVHCSGGIGRTGTFLSAYQTFSNLEDISRAETMPTTTLRPEALSIVNLVDVMRRQRHPWMVEGFHQFQMAHDIVVHLLEDLITDLETKS